MSWRAFYQKRPWLRGYHTHFFPGARYWLQHRTGLILFERGTGPDGLARFFCIAAYHPRESITWIWQVWWFWPTRRRPLGVIHCSRQKRMNWRRGTFAREDGQPLH